MKKILLATASMMVLASCSQIEISETEDYFLRKAEIKIQAKNHTAFLASTIQNHGLSNFQEKQLVVLETNLQSLDPKIKVHQFAAAISQAESAPSLDHTNLTGIQRFQVKFRDIAAESYTRFSTEISKMEYRLMTEDSITVDSVYSLFADFQTDFTTNILSEETAIDHAELSDDEKLALVTAAEVLSGYVPTVMSTLLEEFIQSEANGSDGRVLFLKKLLKAVKKHINFIATVVTRSVTYAVTGAIVGLAVPVGFPANVVAGAIVGGVLGSLRGIQNFQQNINPTCVFCQGDDVDEACYDSNC